MATQETLDLPVRSFVIEPSEDRARLLRVLSLKVFVQYERSVRTAQRHLHLSPYLYETLIPAERTDSKVHHSK